MISGNSYGINSGSSHTISGNMISGNSYGINSGSSHTISGNMISGNSYVIYFGSGHTIINNTGSGNTNYLYLVPCADMRNNLFSGTEHSGYNTDGRLAWHYVSSENHNQLAGAFKAWCRGGVVTKAANVVPTGKAYSYEHACESATFPCFRQLIYTMKRYEKLHYRAYVRKEVSMTYRPRIQIIDFFSDPLVDAANAALAETIMTDSTGTWEQIDAYYFNNSDMPKKVILRTLAMNATGIVYFYPSIEEADISTIEGNISTIEGNISTIEGNISTIAGDVASIEASQSGEESDIGTIQAYMSTLLGAITGAGLTEKTYTLTDASTGLPLVGVQVWATTDESGLNQVDITRTTNDAGQVTFRFNLTAGTPIYIWNRYMAEGDAPDEEEV